MTDLTPNHPAVRAANMGVQEWLAGDGPFDDDLVRLAHDMTAACITAALPHLTADDLRDTDAAEEIRTEGWLQGWAAGRDLDGDEDATPHLRNTPAGHGPGCIPGPSRRRPCRARSRHHPPRGRRHRHLPRRRSKSRRWPRGRRHRVFRPPER